MKNKSRNVPDQVNYFGSSEDQNNINLYKLSDQDFREEMLSLFKTLKEIMNRPKDTRGSGSRNEKSSNKDKRTEKLSGYNENFTKKSHQPQSNSN